MHFSDDDLRDALKRKDPGDGFTQRVMARVEQAKAEGKTRPARKGNGSFLLWWRTRPAWSFAVIAVLLAAFAWGGYEYSEIHHQRIAQQEQQRLEQLRQQQEEAKRQQQEAEQARDEAIMALRIARSKLNHVLEQAQIPVASDPVRRQRL